MNQNQNPDMQSECIVRLCCNCYPTTNCLFVLQTPAWGEKQARLSLSRTHSKGMVILIGGEIAEGSCDQETERNSHGLQWTPFHSTFPHSFFLWSLDNILYTFRETDRKPSSLRLPMRQCMMDRRIAATEWDFKFRKSPPH